MKFKGIRRSSKPDVKMRHGIEESGPNIETPTNAYDDAGTSTGEMVRSDGNVTAPEESLKLNAMKKRMYFCGGMVKK